MTHVVPQNLLGNPGGDYIRDQVYARRGASGIAAMGWATQLSALAPPMRMPQIQAGSNITITHNALGPVIASTGGGGLSDGDYGDITVGGSGTTLTVDNDAITYAKLQNVSATSRILGRKTASAGDAEECTLSEILDFIGSAAQGDILYRDASGWARLAAGTSGHFLKTQGAGANPLWAAASGGGGGSGSVTLLGSVSSSAAKQGGTVMPYDNTKPQIGEGNAFTELDLTVTPVSATSNLIGVVYLPWITASSALTCIIAAFRDSTGDPVQVYSIATTGNEYTYGVCMIYKVPSNAASSTTFKVRYGPNAGSSMSINRGTSSSTLYGNAGVSQHLIFEVAP